MLDMLGVVDMEIFVMAPVALEILDPAVAGPVGVAVSVWAIAGLKVSGLKTAQDACRGHETDCFNLNLGGFIQYVEKWFGFKVV